MYVYIHIFKVLFGGSKPTTVYLCVYAYIEILILCVRLSSKRQMRPDIQHYYQY